MGSRETHKGPCTPKMPSLGPFLHGVRFWVVLWEADAKGISDSSIQVVKGIFVDNRYPFNLSLLSPVKACLEEFRLASV